MAPSNQQSRPSREIPKHPKNFTKDPVGFRVFRVRGDRVEHAYYPLDQVPEHIAP